MAGRIDYREERINAEVRPAVDAPAALAMLRGVERFATDGATAEEMADGCELFDVVEAGRVVGAIALAVEGKHAVITAAWSAGTEARDELAQIEGIARARGARSVALLTKRFGLIRNLLRDGYTIHHAELTKAL